MTAQDAILKDQYTLRVARNSELERMLDALSNGTKLPEADLAEIGGMARSAYMLRLTKPWFDNLQVSMERGGDRIMTANYVNVMPSHIELNAPTVTFGDAHVNGATASAAVDLEPKYRWPSAPAIGNRMESFDKPTWYDTMKVMVQGGRHISLEGPPSVGKDTAVEELAAEMGMPLVTIGGDGGFRQRDLTGGQQMVNGTSFYDIGEYVTAAINGWWVLLTEVNAADADALIYINRQLASPYVVNFGGKTFPIHPNFRLFVSYNHGLVGTKPLPQSFKDRFFSIKVPFFSEYQLRRRLESMSWSNKPEHEYANSIIVDFGIKMWESHTKGRMRYQITTRRLIDACHLVFLGYTVEDSIKASVVDAIDSPVEVNVALQVLQTVIGGM